MNILETKKLTKSFPVGETFWGRPSALLHAVRDVSIEVPQGSVLSLVGESGSGKSTLANMLAGVYPQTSGEIFFGGKSLTNSSHNQIQMVFQDPETSLDPRKTVRFLIKEGMLIHKTGTSQEMENQVSEVLNAVGLSPEILGKYPHELSGGQKQRVAVARSLVLRPKLLLLDEPTSALDVSVQAQVLNLFMELQSMFSLTYVFITHDLKIVSHFSDRICVMYLGRIVESGPVDKVVDTPKHPYTRALLSSIPYPGKELDREPIKGEIPSPLNPPSGCAFRTRCPIAEEKCKELPEMKEFGEQKVLCHFAAYSKAI